MNRFNAQTIVAVAAVTLGFLTPNALGQQYPHSGGSTPPAAAQLQTPSGVPSAYTTRPGGIDPKATAQKHLQLGRKALEEGNVEQALMWAREAQNLAATFGPTEDSPEKLIADAQKAGAAAGNSAAPDLTAAPTAPAIGATAANTQMPQNRVNMQLVGKRNQLIINARLSLSLGKINDAQRIANEAGAMGLPYNPNDDTHENVLRHIQNFLQAAKMRQEKGETPEVLNLMARSYLEQAQTLLGWGQLDRAAELATFAQKLNVEYTQFELKPADILTRVENAKNVRIASRAPAPSTIPAAPSVPPMPSVPATQPTSAPNAGGEILQATAVAPASAGGAAQHAGYNSATDATQNILVANQAPGAGTQLPSQPVASVGQTLLQQALIAFQQGNYDQARQIAAQAEQYRIELTPDNAQRLTDLHSALAASSPAAISAAAPAPMAGAPGTVQPQNALLGQMATEFQNLTSKTQRMTSENPTEALKLLKDFRQKTEDSALSDEHKRLLLRQVDGKIGELENYISDNRTEIDLKDRNAKQFQAAVDDRERIYDKGKRLQEMSEEFNQLLREHRYAEAEMVGKKALELYPEEPVAVMMDFQGKMWNREYQNKRIASEKERGIADHFISIDEGLIIPHSEIEYSTEWADITERRKRWRENKTNYNEKELEIFGKLNTPVQASFKDMPLQAAMETLGNMTGISIHLAPDGLAEMGVTPSAPVTLSLTDEVSLKSALRLILEPLQLDYVIRNEVLMITSKSRKDTNVHTVTYPVADLVIPIPNFQPSKSMGLEGALRSAISAANTNMTPWAQQMMAPEVVTASRAVGTDVRMNPAALGQVQVPIGGSGAGAGVVGGGAAGFGSPGSSVGSGGASEEDFNKLIELIQGTVAPDSWEDTNGTGTIKAFPVNMSLVVSQTQEVHEQIAGLLEQLRRLQDLQITIEVRFISLSDSFYERIGVDFNMNVKTNSASAFTSTGEVTSSAIVGRNDVAGTGDFAPSPLDIAFRQGSAALALPAYGAFDASANAGASMGFAILSDVEAYLFMQAAQSTERSNILQAPKVTLFNGQQALVQDVTDTPFVVSVIPVVGDFAAALQPVIVVLSEGSFMTVQAVASSDRRYVRLTVVPFFSQIGDVTEFTFTGTTSTSSDTTTDGEDEDGNAVVTNQQESGSRTGTTVQLPSYSYVTVTTTVSVPDGGTILLGGIKRLSEGRNEKGVPILNKIPFINRLFQNTGIGRDTSSLMMMVTPRIIIQEEEEERLGVAP
ncbi:MAG: general secretion pathway protein GspD [Planctomycetia bacterium]|nr:general secretion pathway protein GspD [Planctomycetia bacterium]